MKQGGTQRGRRYACSQNAPRPFLLLFRFEFTENRMARWRPYSELVINPWKPPIQGLLWEIANIMTSIFIYFLHCLIFKIVYGLLFAEGPGGGSMVTRYKSFLLWICLWPRGMHIYISGYNVIDGFQEWLLHFNFTNHFIISVAFSVKHSAISLLIFMLLRLL